MDKKVSFHIINSIKGGAGKSTFALMLANYLIQKDKKATIVDLDLQGSSWQENYKEFFEDIKKDKISEEDNNSKTVEKSKKDIYINDLMYLFSNECIDDTLRHIKVESMVSKDEKETVKSHSIPVYIASPKVDRVDDVQTDLFQNAIYRVITNVINSNSEDEIHIILDMPPSKDRYAEVIVTQLLLDINSPLYKEISSKFEYKVNLYMMTNLTASHRDKNINYLKDLARNRSFSDASVYFIKNKRFKLFFIFNDLSKISAFDASDESIKEKIIIEVENELKRISFSKDIDTTSFSKVWFLKHEMLAHKNQVFRMLHEKSLRDSAIKIDSNTNTTFNEFMDKIKLV